MSADTLFFDQWQDVHRKVSEHLKVWEDEAFTFFDEILEEAKKQFSRKDVFLLPKTPSAKRKRVRRKKSSESSCQDDSTVSTESGDNLESSGKSTRSTRSTRATSRATQATRKKTSQEEPILSLIDTYNAEQREEDAQSKRKSSTESTKSKSSKKTKHSTEHPSTDEDNDKLKERKLSGVEPISDAECETSEQTDSARLSTHNADHEDNGVEESFVEVTEEWTQGINDSRLGPDNAEETPMKTITESHSLKTPTTKTQIQNFNHMNVKEKVQAYEEIVLISPAHNFSKDKRAENTPTNTVQPVCAKTPDTVVLKKGDHANTPSEETDCVNGTGSARKSQAGTPRLSTSSRKSVRKSFRESLRTSLHILPSKEKEMKQHLEVPNKPVKRTRLRLKKTNKPEQAEQEQDETASSQEEMDCEDTNTSAGTHAASHSASSASPKSQTEKSSDEEMPPAEEPRAASSTRTKTRHASKKDNPVDPEPAGEATVDDPTSPPRQVQPVRSTRTKTRAQQQQAQASMSDEEMLKKDSGMGGSVSSQPDDTRPRVTRSKMRKPPAEEPADDSAFVSPSAPAPRVTRTKTRKRQLEGGSDDEGRTSKRSCTGSFSEDTNRTPTKCSSTDEESSDGENLSPRCPANKLVRPHPQSFLNNLKPSNSSSALRPTVCGGGMVKSFIARNSPKPTAKEIREKQKKELLEKQKKNEERLKKKEDEYKRKMEEMKLKREEKMKKVQQLREAKIQEEKENRLQLEKRLAEKRKITLKLREERQKEEKEKQKQRLQKFEEAEERRNREEAERKKKLQEQMKNEKSHEAFLQRKKEFEEQERQRRIEEERARQQERQQELERERERERKEREKARLAEEERQREWQKKKEERDRAIAQDRIDKERQELEKKREKDLQMKAEMDRIREQERARLLEQEKEREQQRRQEEEMRRLVEKHNSQVAAGAHTNNAQTSVVKPGLPKPVLNKTRSIEEPSVQQPRCNSYDMTPDRVPNISNDPENYNIDDLNSGDETDDEDAPRKQIPAWAQGSQLKTLLIKQHYNPPDLDKMFDYIEVPDLNVLFEKKKARFNKRTSSAHWDTPILKPGTLGRV